MSTNQPRKPAGTPVGGQWAPMGHAEVDIDLGLRVHRSAAKAKQGLSKKEELALRNRFSAEYNKAEQELSEDLWGEIDRGA